MEIMWKEKVALNSDNLFPGLADSNITLDKKYIKIGTHVLSNLPLQMSLYFNLIFFPFWVLVYLIMVPLKFSSLSNLYQFILVLTFVAVIIIECIRLYVGYIGNLREQISELAGFWLITVLLQMPLQAFLLCSSGLKSSILESIVQTIMCTFLLSQLLCGFIALRNSARQSIISFHLSNFHSQDITGSEKLN